MLTDHRRCSRCAPRQHRPRESVGFRPTSSNVPGSRAEPTEAFEGPAPSRIDAPVHSTAARRASTTARVNFRRARYVAAFGDGSSRQVRLERRVEPPTSRSRRGAAAGHACVPAGRTPRGHNRTCTRAVRYPYCRRCSTHRLTSWGASPALAPRSAPATRRIRILRAAAAPGTGGSRPPGSPC